MRLQSEDWRSNKKYDLLTNTFTNIVNKHASLKKEFKGEIKLLLWPETLGKKFIPEVDFRNTFCKNPNTNPVNNIEYNIKQNIYTGMEVISLMPLWYRI